MGDSRHTQGSHSERMRDLSYLSEDRHQDHRNQPGTLPPGASMANEMFAWVIQCNDKPYPLQQQSLHNCQTHPGSICYTKPSDQIVIFCGYRSPEWVTGIGTYFNISPEVWRRHFDFTPNDRSPRQFEDTKLPSAACDVIQLRIWSIGSRGFRYQRDLAHIEELRRRANISMNAYQSDLSEGRSWQVGDSIVRQYVVHDEEYFSMQQTITIHLSFQGVGDKATWMGNHFLLRFTTEANIEPSSGLCRSW